MKSNMYLIFLVVFPIFCSSQTLFRSGKFLHHSTGQNIWGPNGSSTSIPEQIQIYNANHGYTGANAVTMVEQQWPLHPWQNEWERWHRIFDNQDPQANILPILAANKIVVIKSCYPSSEMTGQGQPSDTLTYELKTVYNYKWHWRSIVNVMRQHPGNFFVIWTNAPHLQVNTNPTAALLAKQFTTWAKDTLAQGLDPVLGNFPPNVYVFHYFALLSDANGYELPQYGVSSNDSHPNALATATVAPYFVNEIFDAAIAYEQGGTSLTVTPSSKNVTYQAGSTGFSVSCNTTWTATSNAGWCTATPSGSGNGTIYANYSTNSGTSSRTATFTVSAPGVSNQTVTVVQAGTSPWITITPSTRSVTSAAGSTTFAVSSNTSWTSSSNAGWCTATASGSGNGTITTAFTANTGTASRTATITVSASGATSQTVTVVQAGTSAGLTVTPSSRSVTPAAGSTTFAVSSNTSWTSSSNAGWCTATASGSGNGTITTAFTANTGSASRTATITVSASGTSSQTVTVVQAGTSAGLTVTPSSRSVTSAAGNTSFSIESNATWTVQSFSGWCSVTPSGSGNGTISAVYLANPFTSDRTATIKIESPGLSNEIVTVVQEGASPELTVSPANQNVESLAGSRVYAIRSNTDWTAQSNSSWCTVTPSGYGNGVITVTFNSNQGAAPRIATITVSATGTPANTVTLTQSGIPLRQSLAVQNLFVGADAGSQVLSPDLPFVCSTQSSADWCMLKHSPETEGSFVAVYDKNESTTDRTAFISIFAENTEIQSYALIQSGIQTNNSNGKSFLVEIYPNPSSGIFTLNIANHKKKDILIMISDQSGRVVYSGHFGNDVSENIDLSREGPGIYAVNVSSADAETETKRIIVK